jgi:DNA polymerase-3 subunit epsilon
MNKLVEPEAKAFIIGTYFSRHHVDFDVEMINAALEKLECGRLKMALDIDMMHLNDITDKQFSLNHYEI